MPIQSIASSFVSPSSESSTASESSASAELHLRALRAARALKTAESELVEAIRLIDGAKVFRERGHSSLFQYVVSELGLSESTAYAFITVARKSREVPELARKISEGSISVSQARKIVPVLTKAESPDAWLEKAALLSQRRLEKEVATVRPETKTPERASYVSASRVKLELGLSETEMLRLRRAQDLLSQNRKRPVSLEETLSALMGEYLSRHDPLEKAKRHQARKGAVGLDEAAHEDAPKNKRTTTKTVGAAENVDVEQSTTNRPSEKGFGNPIGTVKTLESIPASPHRTPIPAAIRHQVYLRDRGRCTRANPDGKRCEQRRWLEIHHLVPVSEGGTHALANLVTLCSAHHRFVHTKGPPRKSPAV